MHAQQFVFGTKPALNTVIFFRTTASKQSCKANGPSFVTGTIAPECGTHSLTLSNYNQHLPLFRHRPTASHPYWAVLPLLRTAACATPYHLLCACG